MSDGPLAGLWYISPPGLLQLAQANDGTFPFETVLATIDGRDGIKAHGEPMPVWGERLQASATSQRGESSEMIARGRILSLVYYLATNQQ